jgi:adenosylhomocysteine nucleosidase
VAQGESDERPAVLLLAAMATELRPLVRALRLQPTEVGGLEARGGRRSDGRSIVAALVGVGPEAAGTATEQLLAATEARRVVLAGVSGGIDPEMTIGTLLSPDLVVERATGREHRPTRPVQGGRTGTLVTCATLAIGEGPVGDLTAQGVAAVDMETAAVAHVCERRGVPWGVVRVISDRPDDHLVDDAVFGLVREDGSTDGRAVARLLARRPWEVRRLARLAGDTRTALAALTPVTLADVSAPGS